MNPANAPQSYAPCPTCPTLNRFELPEESKAPVCGKCKASLRFHDGVVDVSVSGLEKLVTRRMEL